MRSPHILPPRVPHGPQRPTAQLRRGGFVQKTVTPVGRHFAGKQRPQAATLHRLWNVDSGDVEQGGHHVNVQHQRIADVRRVVVPIWRRHDHRHTHGFFIGQHFAGESVFAQKPAVVAHQDHPRLRPQRRRVQLGQQTSHSAIHLLHTGIVIASMSTNGGGIVIAIFEGLRAAAGRGQIIRLPLQTVIPCAGQRHGLRIILRQKLVLCGPRVPLIHMGHLRVQPQHKRLICILSLADEPQ